MLIIHNSCKIYKREDLNKQAGLFSAIRSLLSSFLIIDKN